MVFVERVGVISEVEEASGEVSEAVEMIYMCGMGEWCVVFDLKREKNVALCNKREEREREVITNKTAPLEMMMYFLLLRTTLSLR